MLKKTPCVAITSRRNALEGLRIFMKVRTAKERISERIRRGERTTHDASSRSQPAIANISLSFLRKKEKRQTSSSKAAKG